MTMNANGGTITYTVKVDSSGAVTGIKQAEGKMVSASETAGTKSGGRLSKAWAVATGAIVGITSQVFSRVTSAISSSVSSAMARADTLKNFSTVMQSIGYSAKESDSSIQHLADHLDGLPTTLDDAASKVQMLAASMGNLNQGEVNATSVTEAFNDAMLAGGHGTEAASRAFTQYSQMLARGKVDQMGWNSMVEVASGQMNLLSRELLGADANQADLYEAMKNGVVTFDDFNAALVKLDKEGGENFKSFYEQAVAATGGFQTMVDLVKTSITKVTTAALTGQDMTKALDQTVERFNNVVPSILSAVIKAYAVIIGAIPRVLPNVIQAILDTLPTIIEAAKQLIIGLAEALPQIALMLMEALPDVIDALGEAIPIVVDAICKMFEDEETLDKLIDAWVNVVIAIAQNLPKILEAIAKAIPRIVEALVEFLMDPENVMKLTEAALQLFGALVTSLFTIIGALLSGIGEGLAKLWNAITSHLGEWLSGIGQWAQGLWQNIQNVFAGVGQWFTNTFNGAINGIKSVFGGIGNWFRDRWNDIMNVFSNVWNTFADIGRNIWEGLKSGIGNIAENIKNMFEGAIDNVKQFLGIASPSKLFASIGDYVGQGFVQGIESQTDNAQRALNDLTSGMTASGNIDWNYNNAEASFNEQFASRALGNTYNINVSGTFATSPDERRKVADQIVEAIEMNNRRRFA